MPHLAHMHFTRRSPLARAPGGMAHPKVAHLWTYSLGLSIEQGQGGPRPPGLPVNREEESTATTTSRAFYLRHFSKTYISPKKAAPALRRLTFPPGGLMAG